MFDLPRRSRVAPINGASAPWACHDELRALPRAGQAPVPHEATSRTKPAWRLGSGKATPATPRGAGPLWRRGFTGGEAPRRPSLARAGVSGQFHREKGSLPAGAGKRGGPEEEEELKLYPLTQGVAGAAAQFTPLEVRRREVTASHSVAGVAEGQRVIWPHPPPRPLRGRSPSAPAERPGPSPPGASWRAPVLAIPGERDPRLASRCPAWPLRRRR